ncbi:nuclear protein DGCR14 [Halteromyces radiatus]|uniref:nuclear protein DGCR14 n=1 Tax=Halteromyces radiatus TaxID=101107 RepID=UPI00221F4C59|nr:nuclear protein DGCR14 [Halteromyces radiatus]KAI8086320.1 nuclear protein DGCR14 [Halteromyces radiatus]
MVTPTILDEDTYTEAISYIIERDFFPHLAKMKAESFYHEATINGDPIQLQQAKQLLSNLNQPRSKETDHIQNYYNQQETDLAKRINLELSLDQFQTVYTSEDNASFTDLLEKANAKRKSHYHWFYDKQAQQLCIKDGNHTKQIPTNNLLMYYPEGPSQSILDDTTIRGAPKSITYANTSLTTTNTTTTTTKKDQNHHIPWDQQYDNQSSSTPAFRGFGLVESTPIIHPENLSTPLMTWGSIEGTPIQIKGSETPSGPRFSLPKESAREKLGMKLSEKASRAYRKRTHEKGQTSRGTPRTGSGLMSPAAQHLLRRSNTPYTKGIDMALRSSYGGSSTGHTTSSPRYGKTPTPLFRAGATPKSSRFQINRTTPSFTSHPL